MPTWSNKLGRYLAIGETQDGRMLTFEEVQTLQAKGDHMEVKATPKAKHTSTMIMTNYMKAAIRDVQLSCFHCALKELESAYIYAPKKHEARVWATFETLYKAWHELPGDFADIVK